MVTEGEKERINSRSLYKAFDKSEYISIDNEDIVKQWEQLISYFIR